MKPKNLFYAVISGIIFLSFSPLCTPFASAGNSSLIQNSDDKLEALRKILKKDPNNIEIKAKLYEELIKLATNPAEKISERSNCFQEAVELFPESHEAQYYWGNAYLGEKSYEEAIYHFELAANLNPEYIDCLIQLGQCYYYSLKLEEAISTFEKARKIKPKDFYIQYCLGLAYFDNKDFSSAIEHWEEAITLTSNGQEQNSVQSLINKAKEQLASTENSTQDENQRFIVYYAGDSQKDIGQLTTEILENVYDQVSDDIQCKPDTKIHVIFFRTDDFYSVNQANKWVGALAQGIKILVPLEQGYSDPANIKAIFAHELTHVLINIRTSQNCPTWIHEGAAVRSEMQAANGDPTILYPRYEALLAKLKEEKKYDSISTINLSPSRSDSNASILNGYLQCYLAIRFLYDRWGTQGMDDLLTSLSKGSNVDNAVEEATGRNLQQFQTELEDWISFSL
ncbi:MAG: tetratricopeptide repeat protein [Candidatus Riflebacteria bacterium]|nr:tetratricopeptide repeat protein [Candidatus Riflebacteria bacterium]